MAVVLRFDVLSSIFYRPASGIIRQCDKMTIRTYLEENAKAINKELETYLKRKSSERYVETLLGRSGYEYDNEALTKSVLEPAWYLLDQGGKRWRPVLCLLVIESLGKNPKDYIEFSIIPEVIHNATVIHDDIEDNSDMRRGSPAVHKKFGIDVANNLGDFMYFFPMRALVDSKKLDSDIKNRALSFYIREMTRVSIGQAVDIAWHCGFVDRLSINESKYLEMVHDKTGALSRFACELGAVVGGADDGLVERFGRFGATIGIAFQIQDDILNIYESDLSKNKGGIGDDISEGKMTLLVIHALGSANDVDRKRLVEILSMHTKDKDLIREGIGIITKYGSREHAEGIAVGLVDSAWKELDKALPESEAKARIKELAEFLIKRSI